MKRIVLLLLLFSLIFVSANVTPQEAVQIAGEKLGDVGRNSNVYVEILGKNLLKFQEFFMGVMGFISLGFFDAGGEGSFVNFLFFILLFMMLYSIVGFVFEKFNFGIAFAISVLAFMGINQGMLDSIFLNYEAMGITITVILPILILLAFTFRIYENAYEGKSATSPFYAEMFNLVFLIFFGVFFIRHSAGEEGVIAIMRFVSGWILIGLGIGQTVLYKIVAEMIHDWRRDEEKAKRDLKKMRRDAAGKILEIEAGI